MRIDDLKKKERNLINTKIVNDDFECAINPVFLFIFIWIR